MRKTLCEFLFRVNSAWTILSHAVCRRAPLRVGRVTLASILLFVGFSAVPAAEKQTVPTASASGIYKCRTKDGGLAFVSRIDASLHDCVEIADHTATPVDPSAARNNPSAAIPAPAADAPRHPETQGEHDARVKDMLATVSQWCADNQSPGQKPRDRDKAQSACVVDKMGTYRLLYP
jgi:hypothetical protein